MKKSEILSQSWQDQEALERFRLISPLLQADLDNAKKIRLRHRIAEENNISVRTLYRYEKAFAGNHLAGLRPADREKHRSQELPENFDLLVEQAIQLRKEVPERSVVQIIFILESEGLVSPGVLIGPLLSGSCLLQTQSFSPCSVQKSSNTRVLITSP